MCKFYVHIEWSQEEEEIPSDSFKLVSHLVHVGCTCRFHDRRGDLLIVVDLKRPIEHCLAVLINNLLR